MSLPPLTVEHTLIPRCEWTASRQRHDSFYRREVEPLTRAARHGQPHPVYDFLFDYYNFRPKQLKRWSPGSGVRLEEVTAEDFSGLAHFDPRRGEVTLDTFPANRREGLDWVIRLLEAVDGRPASHSCSGLHEWAMVYRAARPRHAVPLRFPPETVQEIVERQPLTCTHYDAFRFFTAEAAPRNRVRLTKENRMEHDQPGCIHANMDLYKWAYKYYPWISSERIRETFRLALEARVLDMRASPYDLSGWGFTAVKIETDTGRKAYELAQRELARACVPVRRRLLEDLRGLRRALTEAA